MAEEYANVTDQILIEKDTDKPEYDVQEAEKTADWVFGVLEHAADQRKKMTREPYWASDLDFLKGAQWEGPLPTYRRPITMNAWRRAHHISLAVITGGRPTLKLVPQGQMDESALKVWQDGLWAVLKNEHVFEQAYVDALAWAWLADGGWMKVGYGVRGHGTGEQPDVLISAPHPSKVYPDPDCTDPTLRECSYIIFRDTLDLSTITNRYPEHGWRVKPDGHASLKWPQEPPKWIGPSGGDTMSPAGGWRVSADYRREKATVVEYWADESSRETFVEQEIVNLDEVTQYWLDRILGANGHPIAPPAIAAEAMARLTLLAKSPAPKELEKETPWFAERFGGPPPVTPEVRDVKKWRWRYPYGRVITCTRDVVLRDIPNPYGKAFGHSNRWPFVFIPGAHHPSCLWRPGLLSNKIETQRSVNKGLSLLLENFIKVTNALVIADDNAMEDEDWDLLTLVPGAKIRKRTATDVKVVFPQPLPGHAFQFPDYMIRKLEEEVGIHDPPIAPGQSVSSKTVAFMQQKGSFLLGITAKMGDEGLERLGQRVVGLMRDRYVPGRQIPFFHGEMIQGKVGAEMKELPEIPESLQLRVEATSAFQEIMAANMSMAAAGEQAKQRSRPRG